MILPESAHPYNLGYLAMYDVVAGKLVWAVPLAETNSAAFDSPGGDSALVMDSNRNPVIVMSGKQTGAYFITNGGRIRRISGRRSVSRRR